GAELHARDLAEQDLVIAGELDHDFAELFGGDKPRPRQHGELAVPAFEAARRQFDVLGAQGILDILDSQAIGSQPLAVDPDAHRVAALAQDRDVGDAIEVLEPVDDETVDVIGDLERRHALAAERDIHDRLRVGLDLGDGRLVHLGGEVTTDPADAIAHVACGNVGIDAEAEADGDAARFGAARRFEHINAGDTGDRAFEDLGDLAFDDAGGRARVAGRNRYGGLVDVGIFAHGQALERHHPDERDDE